MGVCESCKHCYICASDDSEIYCEVTERRAYLYDSCDNYETREDGLELQQVYDWR